MRVQFPMPRAQAVRFPGPRAALCPPPNARSRSPTRPAPGQVSRAWYMASLIGVKRILIDANHEGRDRQDVGGIPRQYSSSGLECIKLALERYRKAPVGRDNRDAGLQAGGKVRKNFVRKGFRKIQKGCMRRLATAVRSAFQLFQLVCYFRPFISLGQGVLFLDDGFPGFR